MSMTCLMVLLVVIGTCFPRKYVFDTYEGHVAVITIVGCNHLMGYWLFHFLASYQGVKSIFMSFLWHLLSADCISYLWRATPGNYYMHDEVPPDGAFWGNSWQMHGKTRYSPFVGFLLPYVFFFF